MFSLALVLAASVALPPVIANPATAESEWRLVDPSSPGAAAPSAGYLVELPAEGQEVTQDWLSGVVSLSARGVPVVAIGGVPPESVVPYLDGVVLPGRDLAQIEAWSRRHPGIGAVATADDPAVAVAALAAGAVSVLADEPEPSWEDALRGLLPAVRPAVVGEDKLATALRESDLATVIGIPRGFAAASVTVPDTWYGRAELLGHGELSLVRSADSVVVAVPSCPSGGIVVIHRPEGEGGTSEAVRVSGQASLTAAEVLARHQRAQASQDRVVHRWSATERLLVRVWIAELSRSFELVLEGPAYFDEPIGTDWEIARAWIDGVEWDPGDLPEIPLLTPGKPPVPPLSLRLEPAYSYRLVGVEIRQGRRCYGLAFERREPGGTARRGTAWIDAGDFGLAELDETATDLPGEVRSTHSVTSFAQTEVNGVAVHLPRSVIADDLVAAFGGSASIHRELTIADVRIDPPAFDESRAAAWRSERRMLRDGPRGIVRLVPDGRGGRVPEDQARVSQRFLLGGVVVDPGLAFPIPFGGLQIQDFDFRGRGEQLRLFIAGAVNDGAWTARSGRYEISARAFAQLFAFSSAPFVRGREVKGETVETRTQRAGGAVATTLGSTRLKLDVGVNRLDFARTRDTAANFVVPAGTWESVATLSSETVLGQTTVAAAVEAAHRSNWRSWGEDGREPAQDRWRRWHVSVVHERAPMPFAKLTLGAEAWGGRDLDRFSSPSPGRFGGLALRGIAANRVAPTRIEVVRAALAVPLSPRVRGEIGVDAAWAEEPRSGFHRRPLSGVGVGASLPGPFRTLLQVRVGFPLATPGARQATAELFVLRPL